MAIGRISGQMLKSNLLRSGTDLAFETTLLVLDVTNSFVGIGTATPARQLHISGTGALRLPGGTNAERGTPGNGDIRYNSDTGQIEGYNGDWTAMTGGSTLQDADGNTSIAVERTSNENEIHFATDGTDAMHIRSDQTIELNNLKIADRTISSLTTNGDINITPNGTGQTVIKNLSVTDGLDLGDLNALNVGDINVDSVSSDNGTDFDIVLDDNQATALEIKEGANAYMTFVTTDSSEQITVDKKMVITNGVTFQTNTADINGGAIDGTTIGAASAAAGTFTAIVGTSLDNSDGNITNVGDVDVDSISSADGSFDLILDDNTAAALEIKEGANVYVNFATTDGSELITFSKATTIANGVTFTSNTVDINGGAIDGTAIGANSASTGVFSTATATNIQVTNIKANDGTAAGSIADSTGVVTLGSSVLTTTDINGGTIDGVSIGSGTAATALVANGGINIDDDGDGAMDGVVIGANTAAAGTFTTVTTTGNATIGGNLIVNGTTTTIDSETLTIEDPLLTLAKNNSGGSANTFDQGLLFNRGSLDNVSFIWDESADQFAFAVTSGEDGTSAGNVTIDSYAALKAGVVTVSDLETGVISAADGTQSATIANSTGVMTIASSVLTTTDINGGTIDGVSIGSGTAATALVANGGINIDDDGDGAMDGVVIGANTAAAGTFTAIVGSSLSVGDGNITNVGDINVDSVSSDNGTDFDLLLDDNSATALEIKEGATAYMTFDTTNTAEVITASQNFTVLNGKTFTTNTADINGGAIDGTTIGANSAAAGTFTAIVGSSLSVGDGNITNVGDINLDSVSSDNGTDFDILLDDNQAAALEIKEGANAYITFVTTDSSEQITVDKKLVVTNGVTFQTNTADINGGAIDGTTIGAASAAAGTFTTATATNVQTSTVKANDGTAAITIADSTGAVGVSTALTATGNVSVNGGTFIFNESGADLDFRFEGDADANLLFGDAGNDRIGIGTNTPGYSLDIGSKTDAVLLPQGNTAARPTAATGIIRFNTETGKYEGCADGSTYIAFQTEGDTPIISKVSATGDGSTSVFAGFFASAPASVANVLVFIDNVYQEPTENYSISSTNITFTSAPHSGARIFAIVGFDNTAAGSGGVVRTETTATNFTSSATTIASFNATTYRSMEAFITTTDSANTEYEVAKALVVHDGSTAYVTVYGQTSSTGSDLSTYSATLSGGSVLLQAVSAGGQQSAKVQYSLTSA